ncbi:MAG: branched-chain amino acid ABC transporter permease [candidate division WOR-3 bacterium]
MDVQFVCSQVFNGLMLGSFYVLLSLGLTVIFGMLGVVNFAHGVLYMLGAYCAYSICQVFGKHFYLALLLGPLCVGLIGMGIERIFVRRLYSAPHFYNLLLTFGIMIATEEIIRLIFTGVGKPFPTPEPFTGSVDLGFMMFPKYRLFIIGVSAVCAACLTLFIHKTRLGAVLRAGTDDSEMTAALGINVSRVFTLVFGLGAALAGLAGVLAAPVQNIVPDMGTSFLTETFIVVIIGGMGSVLGSVLGGFIVGELITLGAVFWPAFANILVYVFMAMVLLLRPRGFFGRAKFFE